ncbi:MAG: PadR family transcriptional regulator [Halobacteria archaeon]|nr:PadR family transcriptional regulator [Halobacteria archaeon]
MNDLTAFQKNILHVLGDDSMYGLAIKRKLEEYYDEEINHGRLYPNLDFLVENNYIQKNMFDKRTNEYELTDKGRNALLDQIRWELENYINGNNVKDIEGIIEEVKAEGD